MTLHTTDDMQNEAPSVPTYQYDGPFKKAMETAHHYGFRVMKPHKKPKKKKSYGECSAHYLHPDEVRSALSHFMKVYKGYRGPVHITYTRNRRGKHGDVNLEIFGNTSGIAEALAIQALRAILEDEGHNDLVLHINHLGSQESRASFVSEYKKYLRNQMRDVSDDLKDLIRTRPYDVILKDTDETKELMNRMPSTLAFLSAFDREHFKQVLEFIETLDIPYVINNRLIGQSDNQTRTVFQFRKKGGKQPDVFAYGERCDDGAREITNTSIPAVCASVSVRGVGREKYKKNDKKDDVASIFYAHLGNEARCTSLHVLETLRQHSIRVDSSLTTDTMEAQMQYVRKHHIPYALIMGLKEAQENSIIFREMATRMQETVPLEKLPRYLKRRALDS